MTFDNLQHAKRLLCFVIYFTTEINDTRNWDIRVVVFFKKRGINHTEYSIDDKILKANQS